MCVCSLFCNGYLSGGWSWLAATTPPPSASCAVCVHSYNYVCTRAFPDVQRMTSDSDMSILKFPAMNIVMENMPARVFDTSSFTLSLVSLAVCLVCVSDKRASLELHVHRALKSPLFWVYFLDSNVHASRLLWVFIASTVRRIEWCNAHVPYFLFKFQCNGCVFLLLLLGFNGSSEQRLSYTQIYVTSFVQLGFTIWSVGSWI